MTAHNPKDIFNSADNFDLAAKVLESYNKNLFNSASVGEEIRIPFIPGVVLSAFALELYLKCILAIEGNEEKGHNHSKLFSQISQKAQDDIKSAYKIQRQSQNAINDEQDLREYIPEQEFDFDSVLRDCGDAFTSFRYVYESFGNDERLKKLKWLSDRIITVVRQYLIDKHANKIK
jgi:hypothetical protein